MQLLQAPTQQLSRVTSSMQLLLISMLYVQGHASSWQYAQPNGNLNGHGHGHHQNGYSQGLPSADLMLMQHRAKPANQGIPQMKSHGTAVGHEPSAWNGHYDM